MAHPKAYRHYGQQTGPDSHARRRNDVLSRKAVRDRWSPYYQVHDHHQLSTLLAPIINVIDSDDTDTPEPTGSIQTTSTPDSRCDSLDPESTSSCSPENFAFAPKTACSPRAGDSVTMSYPYSSGDGSSYPYTTSTYAAAVPQYTQSQITAYYQQWHCYPPEPYQIIPDPYSQPMHQVVVPSYTTSMGSTQQYYGSSSASLAVPSSSHLSIPEDEELRRRRSQKAGRRSRSGSRTRTWTCDLPSCTSTANFTRLADLQRHQATVHGVGMPEYPCTVPRCNRVGEKGFTRRDHLVEHLRNFHHLDIPKRRPGERSANPMGLPYY